MLSQQLTFFNFVSANGTLISHNKRARAFWLAIETRIFQRIQIILGIIIILTEREKVSPNDSVKLRRCRRGNEMQSAGNKTVFWKGEIILPSKSSLFASFSKLLCINYLIVIELFGVTLRSRWMYSSDGKICRRRVSFLVLIHYIRYYFAFNGKRVFR